MNMWIVLLSVVFTVVAGLITAVLFGRNRCVGVKNHANPTAEAFSPCPESEGRPISSKDAASGHTEPREESECTAQQTTEELLDEPCPLNQEEESAGDQCESVESENEESTGDLSVNGMEEQTLKYMPGMLRTSQLEKMMSREELEEEQRVQHEQLAAIFKLLKENQETFGEVTEKDMEEQLKLYSI